MLIMRIAPAWLGDIVSTYDALCKSSNADGLKHKQGY